MTLPFVNLRDVPFDDVEDNGYYTSRRAMFSAAIGARKLGYHLTELAPGTTPLRDLSLSTVSTAEVCEYPDSQKIGVFARTTPASGVRRMFRVDTAVDHDDGESTEPPAAGA